MGAIATGFSTAFRAYVTDGVPGSGPNKPLKSEARALGTTIETFLDDLVSNSLTAETEFDFATWSGTGATNGIAISTTQLMHSSRDGTGSQNHWRIYNANGLVGSVVTNASATAFNTSSDERLKENFQEFDSGAVIDALHAYRFDWKAGGSGYGVRAQEAVAVFPDAISYDPDGDHWSADYSKFVPLLLAEVRALRARVAELETSSKGKSK